MKRFLALTVTIIILSACFFMACKKTDDTIVFSATIEEVYETGLFVTADEGTGFDKAYVGFPEGMQEITFELAVGQRVKITALNEINESYPVGVTALKIELED